MALEDMKKEADMDTLDWIQLKKELGRDETFREKLVRKTSANPLVPIGCAVTVGALSYGLYSFKTGNVEMSQKMMRLRVFGQTFTLGAIVLGVLYAIGNK